MVLFVILLVFRSRFEPEIGNDVNDFDTPIYEGNRKFRAGRAEAQGSDMHSCAICATSGALNLSPESREARKDFRNILASALARCYHAQIHEWMSLKEADQFLSGITGCTDDCSTNLAHRKSPPEMMKEIREMLN
jgi:hypothetical protein